MTVADPTPTLDAGQRELLGSEHANMLSCIRCGQCLTSCPTYVLSGHESEGPRGRVAMIRALFEGQLELTPDLVAHERNCLVCDACTAVCPAGVHMDPLQVAARTAIEPSVGRPAWQRLLRHLVFRHLFADMRLFRTLVRLIWVYQRTGLQRLARGLRILKLLGLDQTEAFLPAVSGAFVVPKGEVYPAERFDVSAYQETRALADSPHPPPSPRGRGGQSPLSPWERAGGEGYTSSSEGDDKREPVSFFAGCVMSTALADIDRATIRVLQRAGCDVENTAGQGCCGALNAHAGDLPGALELARRNIAAFERDSGGPIVVNSAGCGAMLKDYAHHLRDDPSWAERAAAFSGRVRDATQVLAERELPMRRSVEASVTYQEPCHLVHAQRIVQQPRTLLGAIPGLELREMNESSLCCGSAGIYNVTNPVESRQLQQRKLDNAAATDARIIATANPGCLLQLQSGLTERGSDVRVKHIVELLDEATAP